jgi:hypothetical protein
MIRSESDRFWSRHIYIPLRLAPILRPGYILFLYVQSRCMLSRDTLSTDMICSDACTYDPINFFPVYIYSRNVLFWLAAVLPTLASYIYVSSLLAALYERCLYVTVPSSSPLYSLHSCPFSCYPNPLLSLIISVSLIPSYYS